MTYLLLAGFFILTAVLQIYLCRKELRLGRILPVLFFLNSFVVVIALTIPEEGITMAVLTEFILANIPSAVYYFIFNCFKNKNMKLSLNKKADANL